jgi:transcription elongation factor GreB
MSKAFTRENDDAESETAPTRAEVSVGARRYMTADGAERLRKELASLEERMLPKEDDEDLEEEARRELRRVKTRMQTIAGTLASADIVANADGPVSEVRFGSFVTVRHPDETEDEYRLVGVDEVDLDGTAISWVSPLAQALLGRRVGDVVRFEAPVGERILRIVRIRSVTE